MVKVIVKDLLTGEPTEGVLKKDERFWGGYKVEYGNAILSINAAEIIKEETMKELECPNCEAMNSVPEDCHETNTHFEKECSECGKVFGFTVEYYPSYSEYKVPCANGEPHKYKQIVGAPREFFIGKLRCEYCGDEKSENKVTCEEGVYYLDGYPFKKLDTSFEINKEQAVGEYNDYPNGTFKIYKHLGITYIEGKTLSGDVKLEAEHPNVWFDRIIAK